jgi:hypothetical protein
MLNVSCASSEDAQLVPNSFSEGSGYVWSGKLIKENEYWYLSDIKNVKSRIKISKSWYDEFNKNENKWLSMKSVEITTKDKRDPIEIFTITDFRNK